MAGYMTKLQGYIYEGELVNGASAAVENGILMVRGTSTDVGKLKLIGSADTTTKLLCKEVTTIYDGVTAYRFVVNKLNANYYFVENGFDINDNAAYDKRTYTTAVGAELRAHPLIVGEEFVTDKVTGTIAAGTEYGVKTDGTIG
ncbi:MAG: hypothetical protein J6Y78_16255 [Paludibacteraceae bacterium]|nr:hypothetical protein [Paludibacteraceae bacterium]